MNEEIKKLWVDALRSGEYKQGKKKLHKKGRDGDRFCCLGVLCDLAVKAGVPVKVRDEGGRITYNHRQGLLPVIVSDWAGLPDDNPHVDLAGELVGLTELNDKGRRFTTIAKLIEEQL